MALIQISSINGISPYQIYVSDIFGNNTTYLGSFSGTIPRTRFFGLPIIFDSAEYVMLTIIDVEGCETFEIVSCLIPGHLEIMVYYYRSILQAKFQLGLE